MFHSKPFVDRLNASLGCRVEEYEESGHWLMHTEPQRFNGDVRAFLRDEGNEVA